MLSLYYFSPTLLFHNQVNDFSNMKYSCFRILVFCGHVRACIYNFFLRVRLFICPSLGHKCIESIPMLCCVSVIFTAVLLSIETVLVWFADFGRYLLCRSLRSLECNRPRWEFACGAQSASKLHSENSAAVFLSEILSNSIAIIHRPCCGQFHGGTVSFSTELHR